MDKRVTIQSIASSLGLSRNTVSKALNGNAHVPPKTKALVLQRAAEMNYKQFAVLQDMLLPKGGNIALLTHNMPIKSHFGTKFLSGLEERLSGHGYTLSFYVLRDNDLSNLTLPANCDPDQLAGIVCIELFHPAYSAMVCGLGLPTIFSDTYPGFLRDRLHADVIMMENRISVATLVGQLYAAGRRRFGFVGDKDHCRSFHERWLGFTEALAEFGEVPDSTLCIMDRDRSAQAASYNSVSWMGQRLQAMENLPECFVCANDFIAVNLTTALKRMNVRIPEQVHICGFDDATEARIIEPNLTTVRIHSDEMGQLAAQMLLGRIASPALPTHTLYVNTTIKYRDSAIVPPEFRTLRV